jgi:hypothetical protein
MQSRRQEAQIMSFQMLCPFLQHLITSSNSGKSNFAPTVSTSPPGLAAGILEALRVAITTSNVEIFNAQSSTLPGTELGLQVASLLLPFISLAADTTFFQNGPSSLENINQLVISAMFCLEDLINRPHQPQLKQKILAQVLPAVSALCRSLGETIKSPTTAAAAALDNDLLGVCTRLLTQTVQHSFAFAASNPEIASGVREVLREITNFAATGGGGGVGNFTTCSPLAVLAASEAWHAVLTYMEDLEASNWNEHDSYDNNTSTMNGNDNSSAAEKELTLFYKQGILHFSRLVLSIFFTEPTQNHHQQHHHHLVDLPPPPFLLQNLDTSTGSGSALEEWVAVVGDNNEDFQTEKNLEGSGLGGNDTDDVDAEDGVNEDLLSSCSEAHVFAQQVEFFIAHATSSYNKDLVPVLFSQLAPAMTAAAQARQQSDPGVVYLHNFRAEFALKLVARCAPHLPTNKLTPSSSLPRYSGGGVEGDQGLCGGHVLQLIQALLHFGGEQLNAINTEAQHAQHAQHEVILIGASSVLDTLVTIYRTLSPLMTSWLPQIMLTKAGTDADVQLLVSQLLQAVVEFVAGGIQTSMSVMRLNISCGGGGSKSLAVAASQTLLSVTSIALSSGMKPPIALLQSLNSMPAFYTLSVTVASAVHSQSSVLPRAALRSLMVSLSDLTLRSWGAALQASTVDINERKAALVAVTAPLLQGIQSTAAAQGQLLPDVAQHVALAVSLATDIVESYLGSLKVVRAAVFEVFAQPMLVAVMTVLKHWKNINNCSNGNDGKGLKNKLGTTLLRFVSSCLRAFPAELGTSNIGELLSALVIAFSTMSHTTTSSESNVNDNTSYTDNSTDKFSLEASLDADVVLLSIIASALTQGGSKHAALVMPAMQFGLQIWDKAAMCGATHIKAEVLASLLGIMAQHWRTLGGGGGEDNGVGGGGGGSGGGNGNAATEVQAPAAVVTATLTHVSSSFSDAASTRAIPSASDVNLVLETLIDIQSRTKIFWKPYFGGWKDTTMESILSMLLTRMYTGAQETLIDTLYQLAAANWSHFLLSFLPAFTEKVLAALGARGAELAAGLGTGDMEVWAFEKSVLAFVNDAIYWEKRM